jgi:membrane protein DedA with SNARE-associated domain
VEILNYLIEFFSIYGYFAVLFVLILCGVGLPIPEDITLIAGGVICALSHTTQHKLNLQVMTMVSLFGVLLGDGIMFIMGRRLGPKVTKVKGIRRVITKDIYKKIQDKVHKYGNKILFLARFLPGIRAPIYIMAGVSHKISYFKFLLMDGLAAIISVPILIYLGYFFANDLDVVIDYVKHSEIFIVVLIIIIAILFIVYKKRKKNKNLINK